MNQHQLPSDIVGLAKVMPPLSRRVFMSSSAAAAAGYTLAAGPVRADVIPTDTKGLDAGEAKVKVAGGDMTVYYARPSGVQHPPIVLVCQEIFGIHEWISDVTRRLGHAGAFAVAPDYYFRLGDIAKIGNTQDLMPKVNSKTDVQTVRRSRCRGRLGEIARRRRQPARHHWCLPRRPHCLPF